MQHEDGIKLIHWRKQVRRMSGYKYDKDSLIQRTWREFDERNEKKKNQRLKSLLQRFIAHMIKYKMVLPFKIFVWI
jgi:hypothetical protein